MVCCPPIKPRFQALLSAALLWSGLCFGGSEFLDRASRLELEGRFRDAARVLQQGLATPTLSALERRQYDFELDRLERIKKDYPYSKSELFGELKKAVKGLTAREYERWLGEGRFDSREIDGRRCFMAASVSNLFFRYPELNPRRSPPKDTTTVQIEHWKTCTAIQAAARAEQRPYVLPKRFETTMVVTANTNAAPAGQTIRAWLPLPRQYPFQSDFELLSNSPATIQHLDAAQSPIRSVCLEGTAQKDQATEFRVDYAYTTFGVWFDLKPEVVKPAEASDPALKPFLSEGPHIQFTPAMRELSQQIAGAEPNSYLKAKKFYDWIAGNIKYSFALEYSTIRNIGEYCRAKGYGDCGQEALLFMTLCRLNGIPARWQSGWSTFPGAKSIHDWTEIYLAPYGWVPVDPYMGIYAMRYATALTADQRRELRDFYFGGLDQYRMIANSDHNQTLDPPKRALRSDNVDFQRGELEWGTHNIYFDQFSYDLSVREIELPRKME